MTQSRSRRRTLGTWLAGILAVVLIAAVVLLLPVYPAPAFTRFAVPEGADSMELRPGMRYRASAVWRRLLGSHYRELWTQPITVAVLRFRDFEGGVQPTREGGGVQTRTLHLTSASGKRFVFRSLEKENSRLLRRDLGRSLISWVLNDQTSSAHPAGALVAAPLQAAAGLPAPRPRLVVIPDDSAALGVFAPRFGGLLGTLLEAPAEYEGVAAESKPEVRDTDELFPLLDSASYQQVDARAYLTARLLDFFLNDWDRHQGQWRWAPRPEPSRMLWQPIPVDRDQVFSWYDGWLLSLARLRTNKLARFGPDYPRLAGLTRNSAAIDRRLLAGLARPVWDSVAAWLRLRLTDSVIAAAVARLPAPYRRMSGAALTATLRSRRDGLGAIAAKYYEQLARRPEIHAAGAGTAVRLMHLPGGAAELAVVGTGGKGQAVTWLSRRFDPGETERITVYLHGEGPRLNVTGSEMARIEVRVLDGLGRDHPLAALPR